MSRRKTLGVRKKIALVAGAAALVAGTAIVMTGTSQASVACDGLAQAVRNNENFIAGQRAAPDAQDGSSCPCVRGSAGHRSAHRPPLP
ncbi:hypothetical protein [Streptomyces sp. t39]|uniref:hypothetical protein n=1 Tax=Streptomyces sp. t39 TaxID=1828156 RepID=UPI0029058138|nr:hypothetical protein [Streptomyces sp. t39]